MKEDSVDCLLSIEESVEESVLNECCLIMRILIFDYYFNLSMVVIPKTRKTFCPGECGTHTVHKVTQYKKGK